MRWVIELEECEHIEGGEEHKHSNDIDTSPWKLSERLGGSNILAVMQQAALLVNASVRCGEPWNFRDFDMKAPGHKQGQ